MIQAQSRSRSRQNPLRVLYACNLRPEGTDSAHYYEWEDPADARAVMDSMRAAGCVVEPYDVTTAIASDLSRLRDEFDIVFNNVEMVPGLDLGIASRESILPFYCASLGLPFTGSNFLALAITMDKRLTKAVAAANGIPTPRSLNHNELNGARVRYPCIVKPVAEGSSMGIDDASVARNRRELERAVERVRADYGDAWMIEEFVRGPELAMGIVGHHVLDPVAVDLEAMPGGPLVRSHEVKHGEIDYVVRPELAPERLAELKRFTWKMHVALGTRHYNRMEFIDDGQRFWLIEVNPLPDISATESFLALGASWWGIDFQTMIGLVLWNAVEEYRRDPRYADRFTEERIAPLRRFVDPGQRALNQHLDGPTLSAARREPARSAPASTNR
jgi:D-alanine-D-alanine ligase